MARVALLLTVSAVLAAWAGAQAPAPPLTAAERVKLFKANRVLLENLVENGITLADANDPLKRAQGCYATTMSLAAYLNQAANDDPNPDRAAELAGLMNEVVREGLAPNLEEAARTFPAGSPQAAQLAALQQQSAEKLDAIEKAVAGGKVGGNEKVRAAMEPLAALRDRIKK